MDKDFLLGLPGMTEEVATKVMKKHEESIANKYIPKYRFDEVNGELSQAREQLTERDTQIAELKKFEGDTEALKTKITELETANATVAAEHLKALQLERKQNAIRFALISVEDKVIPHDADMVMGLFDLEQVKLDDSGKIIGGFKEQHEKIKEEKKFLFTEGQVQAEQSGSGWKPKGQTPPSGDQPPAQPDESIAFGKSLAEQRIQMMGGKKPTENK